MPLNEVYWFKIRILIGVFGAVIFSSIFFSIYILTGLKEELSEVNLVGMIGVSLIPLIISHVPWSALRLSPKAQYIKAEYGMKTDFLSILIDLGFLLTVVMAVFIFFDLFHLISLLFIFMVADILFMVFSIKIIWFSPAD